MANADPAAAANAAAAVLAGAGMAPASMAASMAGFANAASSGAFAVSPTGGQALINTIEAFQKWAASQRRQLDFISQEPMLGGSTGAAVMKPFSQQVATDGEGFVTQFQALLQSLDEAKQAIRKAMENYRDADEAGGATVHNAGGPLST